MNSSFLPPSVAWLAAPAPYLVGNGRVCASGPADGSWDFFAGPEYTSPPFLASEHLRLVVDGEVHAWSAPFHRLRATGVYAGTATVAGVRLTVVDAAVPGTAILTRWFGAESAGARPGAEVAVEAVVGLRAHRGRSLQIESGCLLLNVTAAVWASFGDDSGWVPNACDRQAVLGWVDGPGTVTPSHDQEFRLRSVARALPAGGTVDFALRHQARNLLPGTSLDLGALASGTGRADVAATVREAQAWYAGAAPGHGLDRLPAGRVRDLFEGGLAVLRANRTAGGGLVANERKYNLTWTRDAYGGLRGFLAAGFTEPSREFLRFLDRKIQAHGFVPNAVSCGSEAFALYNGNEENNPLRQRGAASPCPEANTAPETPALFVLAARDYHAATGDQDTLDAIDASLRHAIDIQLDHALANGYRLEFSGDETELCGAVRTTAAGFDRRLERYWSLSSVALAAASVEAFSAHLRRRLEDPRRYGNRRSGRTLDLPAEVGRLGEALERDFWRTDLPEAPGGMHDWARLKADPSPLPGRVSHFTLFPAYYGTPNLAPERRRADAAALAAAWDPGTGLLPLVPRVGDGRALGHGLGYLLYALHAAGHPLAPRVAQALVEGPTAGPWGTWAEAHETDGRPNRNTLRTFETGVNLDALAAYYGLGSTATSSLP